MPFCIIAEPLSQLTRCGLIEEEGDKNDAWMNDLAFYILFNSILVISG